ncbi:MAG: hypothetical protein ACE5GO_02720 [Anaerolineales bacterium]
MMFRVEPDVNDFTIFTAPKPFTNPHINIIQRNAIRSWLHLGEDVEVILVGEEAGLAEAASELGVTHLPNVERNQWGTPLVSSIFGLARQHSAASLLCYVNADILLMPDVVEAARRVKAQASQFLLIGRRWNLDVIKPLYFPASWPEMLRARTFRQGRLHPPAGSDYFIFPRHLYTDLPPFAIGRAGWDNWMIYHARQQGWPAIDATPDVMIVHQNHEYSHLGGEPHYDHEESLINVKLARGPENNYTGYMVLDTNKELRGGKMVPPRPTLLRAIRRAELAIMPKEKRGARWALTRRLRKLRRRLIG